MALNPLVKKLRLKPGIAASIVNAPEGYLERLAPLPDDLTIDHELSGKYDWVQVFVLDRAGLAKVSADAFAALKPVSLLWVCFPKGSSKMQTDLNRDVGWESLQAFDLKWTNLVSIDENWSAFSLRPFKPDEERTSFR